jgi:hypothetical protein
MGRERRSSRLFHSLTIALAVAACAPDVPTPADEQRAIDRADADRLAAAVTALPGTVTARAELHRFIADPFAPHAPRPPADATIVIVTTADADATAATATAKALAATAGVPAPRITVARLPPSSPAMTALARIGPFDVASTSATALRLTLVGLLAIIAAVAASVIARYLRRGNKPQ